MQIPSRVEIANHLNGMWMLARMDRGGVSWLDGSVDGLWKSFFAAVMVAPFFVLMLWMGKYAVRPEADLTAIVLIEATAYVGAWLFWPVVAFEICRFLDPKLDARTYIVACNWSEVWILCLRFPLLALWVTGVFSDGVYASLSLLALFAVMFYRFIIARDVLGVGKPFAAGLAVADLITGLMWRTGTDMAVMPWLGS